MFVWVFSRHSKNRLNGMCISVVDFRQSLEMGLEPLVVDGPLDWSARQLRSHSIRSVK